MSFLANSVSEQLNDLMLSFRIGFDEAKVRFRTMSLSQPRRWPNGEGRGVWT